MVGLFVRLLWAFFALPESAWTKSRACLERGGVGCRAQLGRMRCFAVRTAARPNGSERRAPPAFRFSFCRAKFTPAQNAHAAYRLLTGPLTSLKCQAAYSRSY
jgi:hypothetical protein